MLLNAIIEKDDFGYFAYVPSLEGCVSQGDSYEEAVANIKEAKELFFEKENYTDKFIDEIANGLEKSSVFSGKINQ